MKDADPIVGSKHQKPDQLMAEILKKLPRAATGLGSAAHIIMAAETYNSGFRPEGVEEQPVTCSHCGASTVIELFEGQLNLYCIDSGCRLA